MSVVVFNSLMKHDLILRKMKRNVSGDFSIISTDDLKGHVEFNNKIITKKNDEEVKATSLVFLKNDCGIDVDYPYWNINFRKEMEVLEINEVCDPNNGGSVHHYEIYCK